MPSATIESFEPGKPGVTDRQHASNAAMLAMQPLVLNVIGLFATAYIIRTLGPHHYGQWATAAALAAAHGSITNLGLRPLFVRAVASAPHLSRELLREQMGLRLMLGVLAGTGAVLVSYALGYDAVVVTCTALAALGLVLTVLFSALGDLVQAHHQFKVYATVSLAAGLVLTVCSAASAFLGMGPIALTLAYLTGPAVALGSFWVIVTRRFCSVGVSFNRNRVWHLLRESWPIAVQQFATAIRDRGEQLIAPKLLGIGLFGYFAAGALPADRLALMPDGIATAYYPRLAAEPSQGQRVRIAGEMLTAVMAVSLLGAIFLSLIADALAGLLFKDNPAIARLVLHITAWAAPLAGIGMAMTCAMQATGHYEDCSRASLKATVAGGLLAPILIAVGGIVGASWSVVLRHFVMCGLLARVFRHHFRGIRSQVPLWRLGGSAAVVYSVARLFGRDQTSALMQLMIAAGAGGAFVVALVITRVAPRETLAKLVAPTRPDPQHAPAGA